MASIIALAFNPAAWGVAILALSVGFGSGVMLEYRLSQANYWRAQAAAQQQAAADSQKIAGEDSRRATANATEAEKLRNELDKIVKAPAPGACRLSTKEIESLRKLAR